MRTSSETGFYVEPYADDYFCVSGFPEEAYRFRNYNSAYDVEEMLQEKVGKPSTADFDSEFCQLFIIFKNEQDALDYLMQIETYLKGVKQLV
jgi:hypothetical protein